MSGRVLITGASGALGRSVVARFLEAGDRILAVGATQAALAELSALGSADTLALRRVDLSSTPEVEKLFADEEAEAGVPRAVVHLVGGFRWGRFADISDADWTYL
ncbi:MAG TPA: SDR family NAD(P)-dependent oxidoreductase, partial [Thermoanaerobaculia bacterium]|nr:SDR family NAD(P)-dependent oxidoreductase [Thermoanaerobaculia bacterium]